MAGKKIRIPMEVSGRNKEISANMENTDTNTISMVTMGALTHSPLLTLIHIQA